MFIRIVPLFLAALLLAAHFWRAGNLFVAVLCLLVPLLLLVRQRWSLWMVQGLAYGGGGIWLVTTLEIVQQRLKLGQSWGRLVLILGAVTLFTVAAGLMLNTKVIKEKYPPDKT